MYLLTTADRSIENRSRPSSPATTSAAIVFPVPGGPVNSALVPRPRASFVETPVVQDGGGVPNPAANLTQLGLGVCGEHEVMPFVRVVDPPGEPRRPGATEPARDLVPSGPEQLLPARGDPGHRPGRNRGRHRRGDRPEPEAEPVRQLIGRIHRQAGAVQGRPPRVPARGESRSGERHVDHSSGDMVQWEKGPRRGDHHDLAVAGEDAGKLGVPVRRQFGCVEEGQSALQQRLAKDELQLRGQALRTGCRGQVGP